jgi:hypothetical protein
LIVFSCYFVKLQIRDAAAHCEFLYWLEKAMRNGEPVTEMSAAAQFEQFRSSQVNIVSLKLYKQ